MAHPFNRPTNSWPLRPQIAVAAMSPFQREMAMLEGTPSCYCKLPPNCYGRAGWHLQRITREIVEWDVEREFPREARPPEGADRTSFDQRREVRRQFLMRYVGTDRVFEACRPWHERQNAAQRARKAADHDDQREI